MSLRAALNLAVQVVIGVGVALGLALVLAVAREESFADAFRTACWIVGALAFLLGASGQTAWSRTVDTAARLPGLPAVMRPRPGDTTVSAAAVFFLTGALLVALAIVLS